MGQLNDIFDQQFWRQNDLLAEQNANFKNSYEAFRQTRNALANESKIATLTSELDRLRKQVEQYKTEIQSLQKANKQLNEDLTADDRISVPLQDWKQMRFYQRNWLCRFAAWVMR